MPNSQSDTFTREEEEDVFTLQQKLMNVNQYLDHLLDVAGRLDEFLMSEYDLTTGDPKLNALHDELRGVLQEGVVR